METPGLYELLGIDADEQDVRHAEDDARAYEHLIDALVAERKRAGLSQQVVADSMGTTQSAVSDLERLGGDARYSTLQRYARAVGARLAATCVVDEPSVSVPAPVGVVA